MASLIIVLIVIVALLMGIVVLMQNPKGGGLAIGFQGATQVGGVQRTTDFLEKATWYLAIALFVLSMISARYYATSTIEGDDSGTPAATEQPAEGAQGGGEQAPANP
jgi:preprotein translocase subunit SecG